MSLIGEFRVSSEGDLKNYFRMSDECFRVLLDLIKPFITKQNTRMRRAICADEELTATLRFLATGRSFKDFKFTTLISPQALGVIIPETCKHIYKVLKKEYWNIRIILFPWFICRRIKSNEDTKINKATKIKV
jgi:hypothetical protein